MRVVPPPATDNAAGDAARDRAAWRKRLKHGAVVIAGAGFLLTAGGFGWFVSRLPTNEVKLDRNADGIVVLTGGAERIADAIELLAAGRGKRLLITGVHRTTTLSEIARKNPAHDALVSCCVDLDHTAVNTVGNAVETRRWAKSRGFRSVIVVTSSYHMVRTMMELARQLPDVGLIPYPVVTEKQRAERWWTSAPTARLIVTEYLKFILATLRIHLEPAMAATDATSFVSAK